MLYPQDVDNLVNHKTEMKWHFAEMVNISEKEQKNYPIEGQENKFYKKRIDVDNAKTYDTFLEGMVEVNSRLKEHSKPKEENSKKPKKIKLPKLKKIDGK